MKKRIFKIFFLSFLLMSLFSTPAVFAFFTLEEQEAQRLTEEKVTKPRLEQEAARATQEAAAQERYQPTIIPKPKNQPGISIESQKQDVGAGKQLRARILDLVPNLLRTFIGFIAITSTVFLIVSGIRFLTAYGNEEALGEAKKTATWAIIGLLVAIFSYAIVTIITRLPFPG